MLQIEKPYLLFLGDAPDQLRAKTARGIYDWRPEHVVGQMRLDGCKIDFGLADMSLAEAYSKGARTLVLGIVNRGGVIPPDWIAILKQAIECGFDIANGLHAKVSDIDEVSSLAKKLGQRIFDVRHSSEKLPVGTGEKRAGKRLLPLGTDCACGKMYTALSFERDMKALGMNATFRATGQTGILIEGSGISVDAVVSDFLGGCVEVLTPENDPDHWDIIEGQGSLGHPSYSGVTMGLIHGGQPDALVLCHEPTRSHMRGLPHQPLPAIGEIITLGTSLARMVNSQARFVGICVNTSNMDSGDVDDYLKSLEDTYGLPAVDPFTQGTRKIIEAMTAC